MWTPTEPQCLSTLSRSLCQLSLLSHIPDFTAHSTLLFLSFGKNVLFCLEKTQTNQTASLDSIPSSSGHCIFLLPLQKVLPVTLPPSSSLYSFWLARPPHLHLPRATPLLCIATPPLHCHTPSSASPHPSSALSRPLLCIVEESCSILTLHILIC